MQQQQGVPAETFVDERLRLPVAAVGRRNLPPVDDERIRCRGGGLRGSQLQVVVHVDLLPER